MNKGLRKAYEITEARIQFVSLVDKAANLRTFLLKKADDGKASFTTYGRIVKADPESHHVTGIVYEPMAEDSQGNFMTEAEITKAAYWFAKNSGQVDIQHSFKPFKGGTVVESWVAKADFRIGDESIQKGTWLMTVEIENPNVWAAIEKGEITGFSIGGVGNYSKEDVDLSTVNKQEVSEKKGVLKTLAKWIGLEVSEPDTTTELRLSSGGPADSVQKAGKKMSGRNKETLAGIYESLGAFLKEFDDPEPEDDLDQLSNQPPNPNSQRQKPAPGRPMVGTDTEDDDEDKEDNNVSKSEVQKMVDEAIAKATTKPETTGAITPDMVSQMVAASVEKAIEKATKPKEEPITVEQVQEMISASVEKALDPLLKSKGLPSNLSNGTGTVEKQEQHYLHGIL